MSCTTFFSLLNFVFFHYLTDLSHIFATYFDSFNMERIKKEIVRCLAFIFVSSLFTSCSLFIHHFTEFKVRKKVVLKFQGKDTGIRELLNIDGFFEFNGYIGDSCASCGDNNFLAYFGDCYGNAFFDDGTYVNFGIKKKAGKDNKDLILIYESGVYALSHDTIEVEAFQKIGYPDNLKEGLFLRVPKLKRFKIIDRNTIEKIDTYNLYEDTYFNDHLVRTFGEFVTNVPSYEKSIYSFQDSFIFPTADIKMKKKKWLWANKEDWKKWKKSRQEQKKENKPYEILYHDVE